MQNQDKLTQTEVCPLAFVPVQGRSAGAIIRECMEITPHATIYLDEVFIFLPCAGEDIKVCIT